MPEPTPNAPPRVAARIIDPPSMNYADCGPHELVDMAHAGRRLGEVSPRLGQRTPSAMKRLAKLYRIDGRCFSTIVTHVVAVRLLAQGDMEGLAAFRRGDLSHPSVIAAYAAEKINPPRARAEA